VYRRATTSRSWTASEHSVHTTSRAWSTETSGRRCPWLRQHPDEPALVSESPRLDLLPERLQVGVCRGGAEEEGARATVDPGLRRGVERDLAARIRLLDQRPDHRSFLDGHVRAVRSARDGRVDHGLEQPGLAAEGVIDRLDDDPCLRRDKSEPATVRARRRAPSMLATMRVARATKSRPPLGPTAMLPTEAQRV